MPGKTILPTNPPTTNGDEARRFGPNGEFRYIGNFHKTFPHNEFGEVWPGPYEEFRDIAADSPDAPGDYENVDPGATLAAPLVSPQSGRARERLGPNPEQLNMLPPPPVLSASTAAEMTEVFWMALWRDVSTDLLLPDAGGESPAQRGVDELATVFAHALAADGHEGRLRLGLDLPETAGALDLTAQTLFRCGLPDEQHGPLISQFFLLDIPFGTETIVQKQFPYRAKRDYLQSVDAWLQAQNAGRDAHGRAYPKANSFADDGGKAFEPKNLQRRIVTMRDLARFVHKDALHQAYFNAALLLDSLDAPLDAGNPYANHYKRQAGFATLGGPNLLTMVSEVAARALKVVWRQKWMMHRRLRPEAYGGLMTMQAFRGRAYGLPGFVFDTAAARAIREANHGKHGEDSYLLPMAFSSGSPAHPAYGAGHATVAGACVTVLKAWFDETCPIGPLLATGTHPQTREALTLRQPTLKLPAGATDLPAYDKPDAVEMTVGGELNKIASNVAMGRTMGGVHWRSDNTRSLRLGEQIATIIMKREIADYAEKPVSLGYVNFDGNAVMIEKGRVRVPADPVLEGLYKPF